MRADRDRDAGAGTASHRIDGGANSQGPTVTSSRALLLGAVRRPYSHLLEQTGIRPSALQVRLRGHCAVPVQAIERAEACFPEAAVTHEGVAGRGVRGSLLLIPPTPLRALPRLLHRRGACLLPVKRITEGNKRGEVEDHPPTRAAHADRWRILRDVGVVASAAVPCGEDHPGFAAREGHSRDERFNGGQRAVTTGRFRGGGRRQIRVESSLVVLPLPVGFGIALQRNLDVRLTLVPGFRIINPGARPRCGCLSHPRRGAEVQRWPASRVLVQMHSGDSVALQILCRPAQAWTRCSRQGPAAVQISLEAVASALDLASTAVGMWHQRNGLPVITWPGTEWP